MGHEPPNSNRPRLGHRGRPTRVSRNAGHLRTVLASLAEGATMAEILADFPTLAPDDVLAAIAFAATSAQEDLPAVTTHSEPSRAPSRTALAARI